MQKYFGWNRTCSAGKQICTSPKSNAYLHGLNIYLVKVMKKAREDHICAPPSKEKSPHTIYVKDKGIVCTPPLCDRRKFTHHHSEEHHSPWIRWSTSDWSVNQYYARYSHNHGVISSGWPSPGDPSHTYLAQKGHRHKQRGFVGNANKYRYHIAVTGPNLGSVVRRKDDLRTEYAGDHENMGVNLTPTYSTYIHQPHHAQKIAFCPSKHRILIPQAISRIIWSVII